MSALGPAVRVSAREFLVFLEGQVGSRAASEDILRDAFVRSHQGVLRSELARGELRHDEPTCGWFYRSLREAVLDQPRYAGSSEGKLDVFRAELEPKLEPSAALREAITRHLRVVVATLSSEDAELLRRVELEGEDLEAHARRSGTTASRAAERLGTARGELRRHVISSFSTCNTHGFSNCTCGASLGGYGRGQLGATR